MNELKLFFPILKKIKKMLEEKGMTFSDVCVTADQLAHELKRISAKEAENV